MFLALHGWSIMSGSSRSLDSDPLVAVAEQQDGLAEGARPRNKGSLNWTSSQRQGCMAGGVDAAFGHAGQREHWKLCQISPEPACDCSQHDISLESFTFIKTGWRAAGLSNQSISG